VLTAGSVNVGAGGRLNLYGGQITLGSVGTPGTLTVASTGFVHVDGTLPNSTPITFYGGVNNYGTISFIGANITWNDVFLNGNAYITDPSTNIFKNDLVITGSGYLVGGSGDVFEMHKGFLNSSTQAGKWDTSAAELRFIDGSEHLFGVSVTARTKHSRGEKSWLVPAYVCRFSTARRESPAWCCGSTFSTSLMASMRSSSTPGGTDHPLRPDERRKQVARRQGLHERRSDAGRSTPARRARAVDACPSRSRPCWSCRYAQAQALIGNA